MPFQTMVRVFSRFVPLLLILMCSFPAIAQDNLLIISPDDFVEELQPLKRFKDASGRPTIILSLNQICNDPNFANSRDEPEKIKKCIYQYAQLYNITYVLLVGDVDKFPVRSCKAYNTEWGSMYFPSDLYYADIRKSDGSFDDWDGGNPPYGGNKIYGEMDFTGFNPCDLNKLNADRINLYPDVAVARIPASSEDEVTTYVKKVMKYEIKTLGAWFKEAVWVVDNDACQPETKERLDAYLRPFGFSIGHLYFNDWKHLNDAERSEKLNLEMNNGVGFVNHCGHAGSDNWQSWYWTNSMSGLTNIDNLPVIYSTGCGTARFFWQGCGCSGCVPQDYYQDTNGNEWTWADCGLQTTARPEPKSLQPSKYDQESFAEEFLVKRDTGGVAYIGATFKSEFGGDDLDKYFFEAYLVKSRPPTLGEMWKYAQHQFIANVNLCSYYAFIMLHKQTAFGDPTLRVGGAYNTTLLGNLYDGNGGPFISYSRYRIIGNAIVPVGETLTINDGASILFEYGTKITAADSNVSKGLAVNGTSSAPVYLLNTAIGSNMDNVMQGARVSGRIRVRDGGAIKVY